MLFVTDIIARVIFFIPGVIGNLEAAFRNHQILEPVCNADTLMNFGIAGNVIACSRICSNTAGCRGFYFDETNSRCWGSNQTRCQATAGSVYYHKDCGTPPAITNAVLSAGGTHAGETRTYSCSSGYVLRNVVTLDTTCKPDGTWSTPSFDCMWDCSAPLTVANAAISEGDTVGATLRTYTCNDGYEANGTATITCQAGAKWSAVAFSCVPVCPSGWHQIGSSCYIVPNTPTIPGYEIMTFCRNTFPYDTFMLQLETSEENNAIKGFLQNYADGSFCIGLDNPLADNNWTWMATNDPLTFADWCPGQPAGKQPFGAMYQTCTLQWHDISFGTACSPVCELRLPY